MKTTLVLFYKKHPYFTLLINILLASVIGISVEYLINKDFIGSCFIRLYFLDFLKHFPFIKIKNKIDCRKRSFSFHFF